MEIFKGPLAFCVFFINNTHEFESYCQRIKLGEQFQHWNQGRGGEFWEVRVTTAKWSAFIPSNLLNGLGFFLLGIVNKHSRYWLSVTG